jgi:hypothetical protein
MNTPDFQRASLLVLALCAAASCGEDEDNCSGAEIEPTLSPVILGDFRPLEGEPRPGNPEQVPFELSLVLRSTCGAPVIVEEACIVGDGHNGGPDSNAFQLEGPDREEIPPGGDALLRITYDASEPNIDQDGDGVPDPDQIAVVVQSNARNFPTLVIPVCARLIREGTEPSTAPCTAPVQVEPGTADPDLCGG